MGAHSASELLGQRLYEAEQKIKELIVAGDAGLARAEKAEAELAKANCELEHWRDSFSSECEKNGKLWKAAFEERERLQAELAEERERLDWWESHLEYEHSVDYETGEVVMHKVTGPVNDREWREVARTCRLRELIDAARGKR